MNRSLIALGLALSPFVAGCSSDSGSAAVKSGGEQPVLSALDEEGVMARDAALAAMPGFVADEVELVGHDGVNVYCFEGTIDGRECEIAITADGKLLEAEQEIPLDEVPAAVKQAAEAAVPGLVIDEAEKEIEDGTTLYCLEGTAADGKEYEVELTTDGKVVEIESEGDDDDDDHDDD